MQKQRAIKAIKKLKSANIETLNTIANKYDISLAVVMFYYEATR